MAHEEDERKALGARLASARKLASLTMEEAAQVLTHKGYPITKQGVGHWESGRNVPDAIWLRRLAKLYNTTLDALVWDDALSMEAIQFASEFDGLSENQKRVLRALWTAYITEAVTDARVEEHLPPTPDKAVYERVKLKPVNGNHPKKKSA
jgi:transcriptional regulator with XRE-family HTH domain